MVLGPIVESDGVALGSFDAIRREDILAVLGTNDNLVVLRKSGASEGGSSEDG